MASSNPYRLTDGGCRCWSRALDDRCTSQPAARWEWADRSVATVRIRKLAYRRASSGVVPRRRTAVTPMGVAHLRDRFGRCPRRGRATDDLGGVLGELALVEVQLRRPIQLVVVGGILAGSTLGAQTPAQLRDVHDRATALIREMANRPLTVGDTLLTWNPDPGGLIHTVAVDSTGVRSSLLRGDGMIGTADVRWSSQQPSRFDVQWTTRDSATGRSAPDREAHGTLEGESLYVTGTKPAVMLVPRGLWAVADFGMEEQILPVIRRLAADAAPQIISVFRPWHGRWDSVTVTIRDTSGVRTAELLGTDKLQEVMMLTARGDLLWIIRYDQPAERRPLEGSSRYSEYVAQRDLLLALAKRYRPIASMPPVPQ